MSENLGLNGPIDPRGGYSIAQAAVALGVTPRWITDHLINTGECAHKLTGKKVHFYGQWLIDWINRDYTDPDDMTSDGNERK